MKSLKAKALSGDGLSGRNLVTLFRKWDWRDDGYIMLVDADDLYYLHDYRTRVRCTETETANPPHPAPGG